MSSDHPTPKEIIDAVGAVIKYQGISKEEKRVVDGETEVDLFFDQMPVWIFLGLWVFIFVKD